MRTPVEWLNEATGLPIIFYNRLFTSLAGIAILCFLRWLILKAVWRQTENLRVRYQWRRISSYTLFGLAVLLLGRVWFDEFQSVATFLGLLTAGLAIALKDPLVNIAGWLFILWRRPFDVGDRIQIGVHAGDVIDLRVFQFTLMEIGNWVHADQCTGRIVHVPNAKVFVEPQVNYTKGWFDYIWNEVAVLVPYESNWKRAKGILREIAVAHAGQLTGPAERKMMESAKDYMIFSATLAPTVFTSVEESGILLTVRYLCEPRRRRESTQEICEAALERFAECDDIDFAYPTIRYYDNIAEGKPATGGTRSKEGEDTG